MSERAETTVQENPDESRYEAVDESGVLAGFVEYVDRDGARVITHTEVDDAFEGRGVGSTLARGALDAAREAGLSVVPECPFVKAWIDKHPDYADLVA